MENTLKLVFKRDKVEVDVPVTTKFPKGKSVWNIGEHNPYIADGYVILCATEPETCDVLRESLEFLYVGNEEDARTLMNAAGCVEVAVNYIKKLENYRGSYRADTVHKAAELVRKFM